MAGAAMSFFFSFAGSLLMSLLFGQDDDTQSPTYSGSLRTAISNTLPIPLVYGTVKSAGNMIWSKINDDKTWQYKLVSFGDGPIQGFSDVRINDVPIDGNVTALTIWNNVYPDSCVSIDKNNIITLHANGTDIQVEGAIPDHDDGEGNGTGGNEKSFEDVGAEIESYGGGWEVEIPGNTFDAANLIPIVAKSCYNSPVSLQVTKTSDMIKGAWWRGHVGDGSEAIDAIISGQTTTKVWVTVADNGKNGNPTTYAGYKTVKVMGDPVVQACEVGGLKWEAYIAVGVEATNMISDSYNVTAIVQGRLVRVYTSPTAYTIRWSNNPAWCIADFLTCDNGCGLDWSQLDIQSFIDAATYCDELVYNAGGSTTKSKRYTLNYVLDSKKSRLDWITDMMRACCSYPTYQNGLYGMCIEKEVIGSAQSYDPDCMDELQLWWSPIEEVPDKVHVIYVDPKYEWAQIAAQAESKTWLREFPFIKEVEIFGVTNFSQASRLAWFYLNQANTCTMYCKFKTDRRALSRAIGDVIDITDYICQFTNKLFRIMQMSEADDDMIEVTCREYNGSLYTDEYGSVPTSVNYATLSNPFGTIPEVTNINSTQDYYVQKDGTIISNVNLFYSLPDYIFFDHVMVEYSIDDGSTWNSAGTTTNSSFCLTNCKVGLYYLVRVRVVNNIACKSDGAVSSPILILGKDDNPSDLDSNFIVAQVPGGFTFNGSIPSDTDFNRIEIRVDPATGSAGWGNSQYLCSITSLPATIQNTAVADGTRLFRAKAVDNGGNYSTNDVTVIVDVVGTDSYKNIILTRDDAYLGDGTITNLVKLSNNQGFIVPFCVQCGDYDTFGNLPFSVWPNINLSFYYLSPIVDTSKLGLTGVVFDFNISLHDAIAMFGSYGTRTFGLYPLDAFGNVTANSTVGIQMRFSKTSAVIDDTWTDWMTYTPAQYNFRYIQYQINSAFESSTVKAMITQLLQKYDVPDVTFSKNVSVSATGTHVDFGGVFYAQPTQVSVQVVGSTAITATISWDATPSSGLTVHCFNTSGTAVAGNVILVCKGY
jgi:hypothetical protein